MALAASDRGRGTGIQDGFSFDAFEFAFALHDAFVVPLNVSGFRDPSFQGFCVNLPEGGVTGFGGFEGAFFLQALLVE